MTETKNDYGFEVRVIADSMGYGKRITTLELKYPRFIHSEFMTHRMFSRNASSSRAIPVKRIVEAVDEYPARPIHWGVNQKGMQASSEWGDGEVRHNNDWTPLEEWLHSSSDAAAHALILADNGLHKQVVNRILEPYSFIKVIVTATEWDNFFALRDHEAAQPEIRELAQMMKRVMEESEPKELDQGDWHMPYYHDGFWADDGSGVDLHGNPVEVALGVSSARCARVSYRLHDGKETTLESDMNLAAMLKEEQHMSPFEHQATPMGLAAVSIDDEMNLTFDDGVTHFDNQGRYWSGNFQDWVQHRQMKRWREFNFRSLIQGRNNVAVGDEATADIVKKQ